MYYEIRADSNKNRLYVVLEGFFTDQQVKEAADKTIEEIDKLRPGFDVINDISKFKPASTEGAKNIARGQQYALKCGVNRVIRVISDEVIGRMQFERLGHHTHLDADTAALLSRLAQELPPKRAAAVVAELTGLRRRQLYDFLLDSRGD